MNDLNNQILQLLARKAILLEELKAIDSRLAQLSAITQYLTETAPVPAPEPEPQTEAE